MLTQLVDLARSLVARDDEDGQGLAEYALILALIAIVAIVALLFLGSQISDKLTIIGDTLNRRRPERRAIASSSSTATRRAIPAGCLFPIGHLATCQSTRRVSESRHHLGILAAHLAASTRSAQNLPTVLALLASRRQKSRC